jgi:hypothetical protein
MKKFLSILLACISCVAILFTVACDNTNPPATPEGYTTVDTYNEKSTEQIYTDIIAYVAENNTNFTTNVDYDIDATIEMMGTKIPVQIYLDEIVSISGDSYYNKATMTSVCEDFPGIIPDMWAEVWHVNDVAYINNPKNQGAQKIKVDITWDNLCTRLGIDNDKVFNPVHDFSDVSFENVKFYVDKNVEDTKDVDPYFELQIKGDKAQEFSQDRADQMAGTINDAKVTVSTIKYKFYLTENGGLDYIGINYKMNITGKVQGVDVKYTYDFDGEMKFSNVGSTVVSAPSDASSYVDGYLQ